MNNSKKIIMSLTILMALTGFLTQFNFTSTSLVLAENEPVDNKIVFYDATKIDDEETAEVDESALDSSIDYVLGNVLSLGVKIPSSFSESLYLKISIDDKEFYLVQDGTKLQSEVEVLTTNSFSGDNFLGNFRFNNRNYLNKKIILTIGNSNNTNLEINVKEKIEIPEKIPEKIPEEIPEEISE